jgi:glycosyltransferase involved in cell wall biosynthesis
MHVVYVTQVDPTGTSGQNLYSRAVATALARHRSVDLSLVCPTPADALPDDLAGDAITRRYLPPKTRGSPRWHLRSQLPLYRALQDLHGARDIDGIVTTLKPSVIVPPLFALRHRIPHILLVEGMLTRNVRQDPPFPGAHLAVESAVALNAAVSTKVFTAYEEAKDWIAAHPGVDPGTVAVSRHGVDTDLFEPTSRTAARAELGLDVPDGATLIGFVGSFKPYHCLDPLLKTTAAHRSDGTDLRLLLVGDGPRRGTAERRAEALGIAEAVTFTGFVDHEQVSTYIGACDLLYGVIDPDHWGSPMKVYEYLACGRPVVAFDDPELAFVEEVGVGALVDEVSSEAVGRGIDRICEFDPSAWSAAGEAARQHVLTNQTWNMYVETVIDAIRDA